MNIQKNWSTNRLLVSEAIHQDINRLKEICASWDNKVMLEGEEFSENYIEDCLNEGDLPPVSDADKNNYYFMTIRNLNEEIVGFFDLYHGYPDKDTVWISMFLIDKQEQRNSYGREVMEELCNQCLAAGWKFLGLAVHLKNWKGLSFWQKNGFDKLMGIYGDKEYNENAFAIMGLKRELSHH